MLARLRDKYHYTVAIGFSAIFDIAYAKSFGNNADLEPIQQIAQFILKAGGWIGITSFIVGGILMLSLESNNTKNIIVSILGFVGGIAFIAWAVNYYNDKMNEISNSIFN